MSRTDTRLRSRGDVRRPHRAELSDEAIRLARMLHRMVADAGEVAGLLALMLLTDARRSARTSASGEPIPLPEQDRTLWDRALIAEGDPLTSRALAHDQVGEYQLQAAAIAAVHDLPRGRRPYDEPSGAEVSGQAGRSTRPGEQGNGLRRP